MQSLKTSIPNNKYKKIWKEKHVEEKVTECKVAMYAKNKKCQWYIDSGCAKHMTRYRRKIINPKKKEKRSVTFGDNVSAKILGKDRVTLGNNKIKHKICY